MQTPQFEKLMPLNQNEYKFHYFPTLRLQICSVNIGNFLQNKSLKFIPVFYTSTQLKPNLFLKPFLYIFFYFNIEYNTPE